MTTPQKQPTDWFDEQEESDFKREWLRRVHFDMLNPPILVKNLAWIFSGLIMAAITFAVVAAIVAVGVWLWP